MTILVTGGAGFIGSNFIANWLSHSRELIINIDKLTYAGNLENLTPVKKFKNYIFKRGDICDYNFLTSIFKKHRPRAIINFAAETHVDRSILYSKKFIDTNIYGVFQLLEVSRHYFHSLKGLNNSNFRFLHVSTDEVYGDLTLSEKPFDERSRIKPNSPYAASKAASDHLVRAWHKTYGLPVLITNCSNNYGPYQFPEKLIPLTIVNALSKKKIPIYGDGKQIRDWIYVNDHCNAIRRILERGVVGDVYNIGGLNQKKNIQIVNKICDLLDKIIPKKRGDSYKSQIGFVVDRPGHDKRYAVNPNKLMKQLDWMPLETFETGIEKTVLWYIDNFNWIKRIQNRKYRDWIKKQYGKDF
jgi:dTDP-glucose 4,6-dehydratase